MDETPDAAEWIPGRAVAIAPGVRRVLAPNPGPMTGPGTNTYLVGRDRVVILDPGPALDSHVAAILAAVGRATVVAIAVTHTHRDHSPAAAPLHAALGAPRRGALPRHREFHDASFVADLPAGDGTVLDTDVGALRAVATPGHASNHLCWVQPDGRRLYTGDHVLGTVSPVILPPDGDMSEYLDSLARLDALEAQTILPGHGPVLAEPKAVIAGLVRHRQMREARVLAALRDLGPASIEELLPQVYADVDPALHAMARYSLEAHLLKLERERRARRDDGRWQAR
ncbi:MAG TPA: MBL fold metallo-hydrolase [Steroidobacteraceae bacterium]|nr:MBL fold metallo-hydrolase [Steroidobacteraceae bacterium]